MRPASSVFILFQVNLLRADGIMANNRLLAGIATTGSLNGTVITFKFTATGADARYVTVVTQVVIIVWGRASNRPVGRLRSNPEAPLARKLAKSTREEPGGIID